MPANDNEPWAKLIEKLDRLATLSATDRELLRALPYTVETIGGSRTLVREGSAITRCCLLIDGFACRYKTTVDGRRQIVSFHIPGDILDIQHLLLDHADHSVETITPAKIAWVAVEELQALVLDRRDVGQALWRDVLIDASTFREWVLNVGQRDAKTRIAHMLCEFAARLIRSGGASEADCRLPLTQQQIADATGLTAVHVNRMLRTLREDGALVIGSREVRIASFDRLRQIAHFDPAYLHAAA